jgi:hypothetical protein
MTRPAPLARSLDLCTYVGGPSSSPQQWSPSWILFEVIILDILKPHASLVAKLLACASWRWGDGMMEFSGLDLSSIILHHRAREPAVTHRLTGPIWQYLRRSPTSNKLPTQQRAYARTLRTTPPSPAWMQTPSSMPASPRSASVLRLSPSARSDQWLPRLANVPIPRILLK